MRDLYDEAQMILEEATDDSLLRNPTSLQNTVRKPKKKTAALNNPIKEKQSKLCGGSLINIEEVVCNQLQAAFIAESALKNLRADQDLKIAGFDQLTLKFTQVKE